MASEGKPSESNLLAACLQISHFIGQANQDFVSGSVLCGSNQVFFILNSYGDHGVSLKTKINFFVIFAVFYCLVIFLFENEILLTILQILCINT